jgi:hypothetical protein
VRLSKVIALYPLTALTHFRQFIFKTSGTFFDVNLEGLDRFSQRHGHPPLPIRALSAFDNQYPGIFTLSHLQEPESCASQACGWARERRYRIMESAGWSMAAGDNNTRRKRS